MAIISGNKNNLLNPNLVNNLSHIGKKRGLYDVYYEQNDLSGNLLKKCFIYKASNTQFRFSYKNGEPYICVVVTNNGKKYVVNFEKRLSSYYADSHSEDKVLNQISDKNLETLYNIGMENFSE